MQARNAFALIAILVVTAVAYAPGLSGGFVFDDFVNIVDNEQTRMAGLAPTDWLQALTSGSAGPLARPLPMLSFSLERYFFGLDPFPMKLANLGLHLINILLVFVLLRTILLRLSSQDRLRGLTVAPTTLALMVAAAWALAPINLTSVLYVVQRMESLATLFMLAGLITYARGRTLIESGATRAGWRYVIGGLAGFGLLAALSKESGVMLPVYALLIEWLVFGGGRAGSETRRHLTILYTLILAIPGVLGLLWLAPGLISGSAYQNRPFTLSERLWTEARVMWSYISWTLAPVPGKLTLYHDAIPISRGALSPATSLFGALGLLALVGAAYILRTRLVLLALGMFWFLAMHLLVSTVIPLELVYEHRNYLGSLGLYLAVIALLFTGRENDTLRTLRYGLVAGMFALYAAFTLMRANEWADPLRLAHFESSRHPESPRAAYDLGKMLLEWNPSPESPGFWLGMDAIKRASSLDKAGLLPMQALLFMHGKHGLAIPDEWWEQARAHLAGPALSSQDINALYALINAQVQGVITLDMERFEGLLSTALMAHPTRVDLKTLYANFLLNVAGRHAEAYPYLLDATRMAPKDAELWANLARFQFATGQMEAARTSLARVVELDRMGRFAPLIVELQAMDTGAR